MRVWPDCVLSWKRSHLHALAYQVGRDSHGGLAVTLERAGVWRCLAVRKLSEIELRAGEWRTEQHSSRQTRINEVDFEWTLSPEQTRRTGSEVVGAATIGTE